MSSLQLDLQLLVRPNILNLTPYRCARDDYSEGNCHKLHIDFDAVYIKLYTDITFHQR